MAYDPTLGYDPNDPNYDPNADPNRQNSYDPNNPGGFPSSPYGAPFDPTTSSTPTYTPPPLPPGVSGDPTGQVNFAPGTDSQAVEQALPAPTPQGGVAPAGQGTGTFAQPGGAMPGSQASPAGQFPWESQWPVPTGDDPTLWGQIGQAIQAAGGTIGGAGSGPGDIGYYYSRIAGAPGGWGGYDWASRIARGVQGTEPSSASPSGAAAPPIAGANGIPFTDPGQLSAAFRAIMGALPGIQGPTQLQPLDTNTPYEQTLRNSILSAIQEGQAPVTAQDPTIAPLISSIQGQGQRAMNQNAQTVGERLFGQGIPTSSGAYDTATQGFNQGIAENTQGQVANLMVNQLNDRRNRLMTALNIGSNYLTAEQSRQIQTELANVNASLQQYGMQSQVGLGVLSALLGNLHFYDSLGTGANTTAQQQNLASVLGL